MSVKSVVAPSSASVSAVVAAAKEVDVSKNSTQALKDEFDPEFKSKIAKLRRMKFVDVDDLIQRFPYPEELDDEDGVYIWEAKGHNSYIIVTQDIVQDILESEFKELPPATGRIRFYSFLRQRYCGISAPQITAFLEKSDLHSIYRQRRRSQLTKTSVASAPYKQLACDLTDIPQRGVYKNLLVIVDLFTKFAWVVPLAKKSGDVLAREIGNILSSLPEGARVGSLRSDNGSEFKNPQMREKLKETSTKQVFSTPGNPLSNGAVEVSVLTIR
jgi:Integrase core domain